MERMRSIISDPNSNIRVYLLKKKGYKGQYEAVLFPNSLDQTIKETYAENFKSFCDGRDIGEYDSIHSEKDTIKRLPVSDLTYWVGMRDAIAVADRERRLLNKENFTDDYSVIVLDYERSNNGTIDRAYMIAQYRKVESWFRKSIIFGFTANTIEQKNEEIFVLNGCIDLVIVEADVFVFHESAFEKLFNYYEKSCRTIESKKEEIENWRFIDNPRAFYEAVLGKKGPTTKLARALDKAEGDFSRLEPAIVKRTLCQYDDFRGLSYDAEERIVYSPAIRDIVIDILRQTYTRQLFTDNLVRTKGV